MIDEAVELVLDVLIEFIPNIVWKLLAFILGGVITAVGGTMISQSTRTGGAIITIGVILIVGSLISLFK